MKWIFFTTCCSTSEQTTLRPPTCTSMGLFRILRASASMALGKVAENMTVWRSGRTLSTIRITWGEQECPFNKQGEPGSGPGPRQRIKDTHTKGHLKTHLRLKAHVKHPVCLIQHHVRDPTQVGNATYTHQGRRAGRKWSIQEKPASTL